MSAKDSMAKEYFADNARFADLCNNILYGGREVILPENLKERDTTEVLTALGLDKKTIAMQKMRDIFKNASIKYTGRSYVVLIGVETRTSGTKMPVDTTALCEKIRQRMRRCMR